MALPGNRNVQTTLHSLVGDAIKLSVFFFEEEPCFWYVSFTEIDRNLQTALDSFVLWCAGLQDLMLHCCSSTVAGEIYSEEMVLVLNLAANGTAFPLSMRAWVCGCA